MLSIFYAGRRKAGWPGVAQVRNPRVSHPACRQCGGWVTEPGGQILDVAVGASVDDGVIGHDIPIRLAARIELRLWSGVAGQGDPEVGAVRTGEGRCER